MMVMMMKQEGDQEEVKEAELPDLLPHVSLKTSGRKRLNHFGGI